MIPFFKFNCVLNYSELSIGQHIKRRKRIKICLLIMVPENCQEFSIKLRSSISESFRPYVAVMVS